MIDDELIQELAEVQDRKARGETYDQTTEEFRAAMARAGATSEQMKEAADRLSQAVVQLGHALSEAFGAIADVVAAAVNEVWPAVKELVEELADYAAEEEEHRDEDQHDGAVTSWVVWMLPPKTIEELYGQGVDRGPGPRPVLIRTADDGLWRAETGENRKETAMLITMNFALVTIAVILFLGVVGEKDEKHNRNLTQAFMSVMAAIVLVNICACV